MLEASSPKARQDGNRLSGIVLVLSLFGALIFLAQTQQMSRGSAPEAQISIQPE
jgi:hypothetical protein